MRTITTAKDEQGRQAALAALLPLHQGDLEAVFRAAGSVSVTVRLLDPPLQDFLPTLDEINADISDARGEENWERLFDLNNLRRQCTAQAVVDLSMGHRACRLSLTHPDILCMQLAAILGSAATVSAEGTAVIPNILLPLVASEEETSALVKKVRACAAEFSAAKETEVKFRLGVLIELPRAALCAGHISDHVDFVVFGTNDLTQMTYGFSKRDVHTYLASYLRQGILARDPFASLDQDGVGRLISLAADAIRERHPDMELGVCGDHTSDTESLRFLQAIGISHVSCPAGFVRCAMEVCV